MVLVFTGGRTMHKLIIDTNLKTYEWSDGIYRNDIMVYTLKELRDLEILLIKEGYMEIE